MGDGDVGLRGGAPAVSLVLMRRTPYPAGITTRGRWLRGAERAVVEIGFAGPAVGRVNSPIRSLASTAIEVAIPRMVSRLK